MVLLQSINGNIICKDNDPKELYVAINELAFHLEKKESLLQCCYWVEWGIEFERKCRIKKKPIYCERRVFAPVDSKFQLDIIWIIFRYIKIFVNHSFLIGPTKDLRNNLSRKIKNLYLLIL